MTTEEQVQAEAKVLVDAMTQTISSSCEHDSYCKRKECQCKGMVVCVVNQNEAKQCALISIDKIISLRVQPMEYYEQVKKAIIDYK